MTARDWLWVNIMLTSWMAFGVPERVAEMLVPIIVWYWGIGS
jgi:hypothetical protein